MNQTHPLQFNWHHALGALAISIATCMDIPATAAPTEDNFHVAQVGIRSNIQSPVPLNLRPRVIISPNSNHNSYGSRHHYPRRNPYYNHRQPTHYRRNGHHKKVIIITPGGGHNRHHHPYNHNYGDGRNYRNYSNGGTYIKIGY